MPDFPMHVSVPDAVRALAALLPDPGVERVPLNAAFGRTLAADLAALVSHPSATESALDGIAAREADTLSATAEAPVPLRVVGESRAGMAFAGAVGTGECVRIYTGAPVPRGADAICPVEQLRDDGERVLLLRPASPRDIRHEGNDFRAGEVVLRAGLRLTPARVALAAALGHAVVPVCRPVRVGLLATGDEVVAPGEPLHAGQVYDSNSFGLTGLLHDAGCEVVPLGRAPDAPDALAARLGASGGVHLLLTSGGVSMGRYDFMRDLLIAQGRVHFWKVRMRPGGPALLGEWRGLPVFGLPGNPVSALVVFQVIARPALTGRPARTVRLRAATPFRGLPDKTAYWRATVDSVGVHEYGAQGSGVLRSLSDTDALAVIPEGANIAVGDEVDVLL